MNSYAVTDIGQVRRSNQDFVYASDLALGRLPNFYMVADGMGGHRGGGFVSRYAVERMTEILAAEEKLEIIPSLTAALNTVNSELYRKAGSFDELKGMGTTMVAATVSENVLYVLNIGDSRLYLVNDGIRQVTRDHSWVEDMVAEGRMVRGSALYYKKKNVITRAVGVSDTVTADFFEIELKAGDRILLCSDGLSNAVSDEEMLEIVEKRGVSQEAAYSLVQLGNTHGASDNMSVIMIDPEINEVETC